MPRVIIVGGGTAGCVVASRLSEDARFDVSLLEAGPGYPTLDSFPAEILKSTSRSLRSHDWGFQSAPDSLGRSIPIPRAKLIGGCSSTNATISLRGTPSDYDEWVQVAGDAWSFANVLPTFRRMESDREFQNEWHGAAGPYPIQRDHSDEITPLQVAFQDACLEAGYRAVADHNSPDGTGVGLIPKNTVNGRRMNAAITYLLPARSRANLRVRGDTQVDRILFEGNNAIGVKLAGSGEEMLADLTIVCAGTYGTPHLLLRSGVGPRPQLENFKIDCVSALQGVGKNLSDHVLCRFEYASPWAPSRGDEVIQRQIGLTLRTSKSAHQHDIQILPQSVMPAAEPTDDEPGEFQITVALLKPLSRGTVELESRSPEVPPRIDPNFFSHPEDMERMVEAARAVRKIVTSARMSEFIVRERHPGFDVDTDDRLAESILQGVRTYHHPVGTCRMGEAGDDGAVVSPRGVVHGTERLLIGDASIMPTVPGANTNLPAAMVAERISEWLIQDST